MGQGAVGKLTLDAYPNRGEAFVGAQHKTLGNTAQALAFAEKAQAASLVAHESHVASCKTEATEAQAEFDRRCDGFSEAEVKGITDRFEERREQAKQDEADIEAIRNRRR